MKPIQLQEIRKAIGAKIISPLPDDSMSIDAVCTDTRAMRPGSLFIALRGDNFDGHAFLQQAAAGGAIAALVQDIPADCPPGMQLLQTADTRIAMGKLAKFVRQQMRAKVIAVAGSNGKTGTKNLIDAALRGKLSGTISPKSFNNDIGVPLAIFPADPLQDYLVLEMGTNHPGEIRVLTTMATPDIAVITNCFAEHLEGLGDINGVRRENASIIEGLNPKSLLIVNGDDPELLRAVAGFRGQRVTFGLSPNNDLFATNIQCGVDGTRFNLNGRTTRAFVPLLGKHSACNALAAIAVARKMGLSEWEILENLLTARGPEMRLQLQEAAGIRVLNDAYNANPASMKAAMETLASLPCPGRRIAILGDMREMGEASRSSHEEIGQFIAKKCPPDWLICVGTEAKIIAEQAAKNGISADRIEHFPDANSATAIVSRLIPGDTVLLKASRAIHLEIVGQAIAGLASTALKAAS
jgi:UDP-N-acetylmuramoyl-tripeptide--D-alanyl-D-alanine ligase